MIVKFTRNGRSVEKKSKKSTDSDCSETLSLQLSAC